MRKTLGKSKYQINATKKVETNQSRPGGSNNPKYYDEEFLKSRKNRKNTGFALFTIATLLIAGGIIAGVQINKSRLQTESERFLKPSGDYDPTAFDSTTTTPTSGIQPGDTARLEYTLWVDFDGNGNVDITTESPFQGPAEFDANMVKGSLIAGFYYEVLGMSVGETKTFEIPGQLDANNDGIEDGTDNELLGYGPSNSDLYNKLLVFRVRVISIN